MGHAEKGHALPGWLKGSVKGLGNVCPLQSLKASIHSPVPPGILHPRPSFLQGRREKSIPPTADTQPPLQGEEHPLSSWAVLSRYCCGDAGEPKTPPPRKTQQGLAASSHHQSQTLPKMLGTSLYPGSSLRGFWDLGLSLPNGYDQGAKEAPALLIQRAEHQ